MPNLTKSFRDVLSVLFIAVTLILPVSPVNAAGNYVFRTLDGGETNAAHYLLSSDGNHLVWQNTIHYDANHSSSLGLFYFDGHDSFQVSRSLSQDDFGYDDRAVISGNYIGYVHHYTGGSQQVFVYNLTTRQSTQITTSSQEKNELAIKNNRLVWDEKSNDSAKQDIWLYDLTSQSLTQVTSDGSSGVYNLAPQLSGSKLYWTKAFNNIYELDLGSGSTDQIVASPTRIVDLVADGNNLAWTAEHPNSAQGRNGRDVFFYDGSNSSQVTSSDYGNYYLKLKGNILVWQSNDPSYGASFYNIATHDLESVALQGDSVNTDGQRIVFADLLPNGYYRPAIKDVATGQMSYVNFSGTILNQAYSSIMVVANDFVAWSGALSSLSPNQQQYKQVYVAEPDTTPAAPQNLIGNTPTNQSPHLSWSPVAGVNTYKIYRGGMLIGSSSTSNYDDMGINADGSYAYTVTAVSSTNSESLPSNQAIILYDKTPPTGSFTGSTLVIRLLGQKINGTASDVLAGVSRVQIKSGGAMLSSDSGGGITLSCNGAKTSCTWIANPATLSAGLHTLTLIVTDLAGNTYQTTKSYIII